MHYVGINRHIMPIIGNCRHNMPYYAYVWQNMPTPRHVMPKYAKIPLHRPNVDLEVVSTNAILGMTIRTASDKK